MENNFLPTGYEPPKSNTNYMRFEEGENRFRVLSSAIVGYEYWTTDNKPVRSREFPTQTPNIKTDKEGKTRINHFWAFVVWNYRDEKVQILELTQRGIQKSITNLVNNTDWGDPKNYDIVVTRQGLDLNTEYDVAPIPHKPVPEEAVKEYEGMTINLEQLYVGGDPFEQEPTPYQTAKEQAEIGQEKTGDFKTEDVKM